MKKIFGLAITALLCFSSAYAAPAVTNTSTATPIGCWKQMDDVTKELNSIVKIYKNGETFGGKLLKTYAVGGKATDKICEKCPGSFKNKPILGLDFMWGFRQQGNEWANGKILDPKTGSIYSAKMHLENNGGVLKLRGFMGVSLLGRTQTWYKTKC